MNRHKLNAELLFQSICHYDRMIEFAGTQCSDNSPCTFPMRLSIKEVWLSDDCALCKEYLRSDFESCTSCPLGSCGRSSIWYYMNKSETWYHWILHAVALRQRLISLLRDNI